MVDEMLLIDGKQWITRTARQTSKFLIEYCGGDNERLTWLVGKIRCGGRVRTEAERSDLLGLCVLALQTRNTRRKSRRVSLCFCVNNRIAKGISGRRLHGLPGGKGAAPGLAKCFG